MDRADRDLAAPQRRARRIRCSVRRAHVPTQLARYRDRGEWHGRRDHDRLRRAARATARDRGSVRGKRGCGDQVPHRPRGRRGHRTQPPHARRMRGARRLRLGSLGPRPAASIVRTDHGHGGPRNRGPHPRTVARIQAGDAMNDPLSPNRVAAMAAHIRPAFNVPHLPQLQQYRLLFTKAAMETKLVGPCMLAAIVQRESGGRNILQEGALPGPGAGCGLTQITYGVDWTQRAVPCYPGFGRLLDPLTNLRVSASQFLQPALAAFPGNLVAAFAAYNLGIGGVQEEIAQGLNPDARTTGGN